MITVRRLIALLEWLPRDARIHAYEGEGIGLVIQAKDESWWINATPNDDEDGQEEFYDAFQDK